MKSYFLQVKEVIQETNDTVTIQFWHPLSEQIKYKAGQFLTVVVPGPEGKKVKRSYSMSSSPVTDSSVAITIKRVQGGLVSNYLNDKVKKGDFLEVNESMGHFVFDPENYSSGKLFLIGAGSGITPLISIAKTALKALDSLSVFVFYGSRFENQIIFKKELEQLENQYKGRFTLSNIISKPSENWSGLTGRINQASATQWLKDHNVDFKRDHFYVCGPEEMLESVLKITELYEVDKERVHYERFNAPVVDEGEIEAEGLEKRSVKVKYDGDEFVFDVEPHQSILEAALDQDIDLPYSCQAGMCTACLGKCVQGNIKMDEDEGLTDKEKDQGYVLTCVSHPLSNDVVIEID